MSTDSSAAHHQSSPHHAHHYDSPEQQYSAAKQGIWLFMATEIVMFGGLFVAYLIFRNLYPEVFAEGAKLLDWRMGSLNTIVLILSSLTMALGIHYLQVGDKNKASINLLITVVCAATFMVVKYFEYSHKIHAGTLPANFFHYTPEGGGTAAPNLALFFGMYFMMTGLHGIHVVAGAVLIFWLFLRTRRGDFGPHYYTPVEGIGIFWHIVDLIWIFLFPLYYLV
jgi:cytochrome c oxidase subunit III